MNKIEKVSDTSIRITKTTDTVSTVSLKYLYARRDYLQAQVDECQDQINQAEGLGVVQDTILQVNKLNIQ